MPQQADVQGSQTEYAVSGPPGRAIEEYEPLSPLREPCGTDDSRRVCARKDGLLILTEEDLPVWDGLVEMSGQSSVFCKSWWLKAACDQVRVLGLFNAGRLIAGIPLHYGQRMGLRMCRMPPLTQTLGIVIAPLEGKSATVHARETEILDIFAEKLARESIFIQAFHPGIQNWLPFYWRGFTQTTHYTYVFDDLTSMHSLWQGLSPERRTNIRKARKFGLTVKECGPEEVFLVSEKVFARQGKNTPYTLDYLCRLYEAARSMNAGVCLAAQDPSGKVHAADFFVWDSRRGYLLAGGHDSSLGSSGGSVLLAWDLIEFAATRTAIFDFEGSMTRSIEASFRSFGARRVAYNRIVKMPRWLRVCLAAAGRVQL